MFFDFFRDLSAKTPTCESISGKQLSRNALKSRCFRWEGYDKVKKTSHRSVTRVTKYCKTYLKRAKMIPSPDPADPGDLVHGLQLGTSPTRAGGQDDVS